MAFLYKITFARLCAIAMIVVLMFAICSCGLPEPTNPRNYTVTYLAGEGGSIVGNATQTVIEGENATEVEAVADDGYTFVEWSDDVETAKRTDKNVDVTYSSFYMFKDNKDGKLYRGPLWDYDISSDNCNYSGGVNATNSLYASYTNTLYGKLLEYPEFRALVTNLLNEKARQIVVTLDNCVTYLFARSSAMERNFERWQLLNWGQFDGWCPVPGHLQAMTTWQQHVNHLRSWLANSLDYMLSQYRL